MNIELLNHLILSHFSKLNDLKKLITKQSDQINLLYDESMDLTKYLTDIQNYLKPSLDVKILQLISSELNKTIPKSEDDYNNPWFINYNLYENVKKKIKNIREIKNVIDTKIINININLSKEKINQLLIDENHNIDIEQKIQLQKLLNKIDQQEKYIEDINSEINNLNKQLLSIIDAKQIILFNSQIILFNSQIEQLKLKELNDYQIKNINNLEDKIKNIINSKNLLNDKISTFKSNLEKINLYNIYSVNFFQSEYQTMNDFKEKNNDNLDQQQNIDIITILNEYDTIIKYKQNINLEINKIDTKLNSGQIDINIINNFFNIQKKKLDYEQKQKIKILYDLLDKKENMDSELIYYYESNKYIIDLDKQIDSFKQESNKINFDNFDLNNITKSNNLIDNIKKLLKEMKNKNYSDDNEKIVTLKNLIQKYNILGNKINFYEKKKDSISKDSDSELISSKKFGHIIFDKNKYIDKYNDLIKEIEQSCKDIKYTFTYDHKTINNLIDSIKILINKLK